MEKKLTKEQVKELLEGKKIIDVELSPYMQLKLEDNSTIEIVPEQLRVNEVTYLDLVFKQQFDND